MKQKTEMILKIPLVIDEKDRWNDNHKEPAVMLDHLEVFNIYDRELLEKSGIDYIYELSDLYRLNGITIVSDIIIDRHQECNGGFLQSYYTFIIENNDTKKQSTLVINCCYNSDKFIYDHMTITNIDILYNSI